MQKETGVIFHRGHITRHIKIVFTSINILIVGVDATIS